MGANIVYGLYDVPPSESYLDCPRCDYFGLTMAQLHYRVVDMEDMRKFWLKKENITALRFFEMLTRLLKVYPLFSEFFTVLQYLFTDPVLTSFGSAKFTGQVGTETIELVQRTTPMNVLTIYTLVDSLAGSNCGELGYKLGTIVRMTTGKSLPLEDIIDA